MTYQREYVEYAEVKKDLLTRLWQGDVKLVITYWWFEFAVMMVIGLLKPTLNHTIENNSYMSGFDRSFSTNFGLIIFLTYVVFINVAVWRSAANYKRINPARKIWGLVAQLKVILLGCIPALAFFVALSNGISSTTVSQPMNATTAVDQIHAVENNLNAQLPARMNDGSVLTRIDYQKEHWTYHILAATSLDPWGLDSRRIHDRNVSTMCGVAAYREMLRSAGPLVYQYLDQAGNSTQVIMEKDDCGV